MNPDINYAAWCRAVKAHEMRRTKKDRWPLVGFTLCLWSALIVIGVVGYLVYRF